MSSLFVQPPDGCQEQENTQLFLVFAAREFDKEIRAIYQTLK